jgi:ribonuclease Z
MPTSIYRSETSTYEDALVLSAIIECGEGTLSSLFKHIESLSCHPSSLEEHLSYVNFIWISHAHLDHYGDVSNVVQAVAKAKRKAQNTQPVILIAPAKVLKYLRVLLLKPSAQKIEDRQYIGITHREFQTSPFVGHVRSMVYDHTLMMPRYSSHPKNYGTQATKLYKPFASIQNVEVEHCREAYGLLLQMYIPMKGAFNSFVLCFSGDTRPSARLTKACQIYSQNNPISLLIHEATFLHDSQGREDAIRKRHSTVKEALNVATNIGAEACLLTHFSQRYTHVSVDDVSGDGSGNSYKRSWGIACDGMLIPLTKRGMDSLLPLTKCIDAILSLPKI